MTTTASGAEGTLLSGRYQLLDRLGAGGTGTVYRALDTVTGGIVAVKILSHLTTSAALRHRREVLALRALQAPGVVRLLDDGAADGRLFLVMELVDGEPFPGHGRRTWDEIGPTVMALLETLARVHTRGVIHRDLKPGNVLVEASGRPVLLDFGLARGDTLGDAITRPDAVVGTPRYQAPEQLTNQALDPRTDLYAVGLMIYEVLAGRPPHPLDNLSSLVSARVWRDAPPLQYAAPDAPTAVCRVVDRLLVRLPEGRPRSAVEVLDDLRRLTADGGRPPLPWLGGDALLRDALDAVHAQRPFDLAGPPGSGRTRALREIAAALTRAGRRTAFAARGGRPFESLAPIVGQPDTVELRADDVVTGDTVSLHTPPVSLDEPTLLDALPVAPPADIPGQLLRRLRETLAGGTVVLVDDAEEIDPWSADLLDAARADGPVLRAWDGAPGVGDVPADARLLRPLGEADLRPLFRGPDRLLHLREDAARALHERTGGNPGRVVAELAAWVSGGFATVEDGLHVLDRTGLDRLDGGVAVQVPAPPGAGGVPLKRALERVLAWVTLAWPHSTRALLHAVCGAEAWQIDLTLQELERVSAVRRTDDGRYEPRVAAVSLQEWTAEGRQQAHAAIAAQLAPGTAGRFGHLVAAGDFARAAEEARGLAGKLVADGYLGRALGVLSQGLLAAREAGDVAMEERLLVDAACTALAEGLAGAVKHVRYELGRSTPAALTPALDRLLVGGLALVTGDGAAIRAVADEIPPFDEPALEVWRRAIRLHPLLADIAHAQAWLDECVAWAEGNPFLLGRVYGWTGLLRYREGRYADAAAWHLRALPLKEGTADRLSTMINAASCFLEAQDHEQALSLALTAEALAAERRLVYFEARATWIRRCVEYRLGVATRPDEELADAAVHLGAGRTESMLLMNEAAIAWRAGNPLAARFARRAARLYEDDGNRAARLTCIALADLIEHLRDPAHWRAHAEAALALQPGVGQAQAMGLVAAAGVVWDPAWTVALEHALAAQPSGDPLLRRAVLADAEILAYARKAADRSE